MKRMMIIAALAVGHFVVAGGLFLQTFGMSMARFDTGAAPSRLESALQTTREILFLPVGPIIDHCPHQWFPGLLGWFPFAANSLLWGACLYFAFVVLARTIRRRGDAEHPAAG